MKNTFFYITPFSGSLESSECLAGSNPRTTFSSFLPLFRMMLLYLQTKVLLRGANVDDEEKMELLTTYKEWLVQQFKPQQEANFNLKNDLKGILLYSMSYVRASTCKKS